MGALEDVCRRAWDVYSSRAFLHQYSKFGLEADELCFKVQYTVACILSRVAPMACVYLFFRDQLQNDEKITSIRGYIYKYKRVIQLNASSTFSWGLQVSYLRSSLCALLSDDILKRLQVIGHSTEP